MRGNKLIITSIIIASGLIISSIIIKDSNFLSSYFNTSDFPGYLEIGIARPIEVDLEQEGKVNEPLSMGEAANYIGIETIDLKRMILIDSESIPYIMIGDDYIFSKSAIDRWLEELATEHYKFDFRK